MNQVTWDIIDLVSTCHVFSQKSENRFFIIVVYVDDVNIIRTLEEILKAIDLLKK